MIANLKGNGIRVSSQQFPDIYQHFLTCCQKLNFRKNPELYILNSEGLLNALATRFLRRNYVVLYSSVVDALESRSSALRFYLGHELGHIKRRHLLWGWFIEPMTFLPIVGKAYLRAREYTCDRYGFACSEDVNDAFAAITVLAAGYQSWKKMNLEEYKKQSQLTGGFWLSFHELNASYPWLCKRFAWIEALSKRSIPVFPKRNLLSFLISSLIPNISGLLSLVVVLYMSYIVYTFRNELKIEKDIVPKEVREAIQYAREITIDLNLYVYTHNGSFPRSLTEIGYSEQTNKIFLRSAEFNQIFNRLTLTLQSQDHSLDNKTIIFIPYIRGGKIAWSCNNGSLENEFRPNECKKTN